jgi:hypothetical protein
MTCEGELVYMFEVINRQDTNGTLSYCDDNNKFFAYAPPDWTRHTLKRGVNITRGRNDITIEYTGFMNEKFWVSLLPNPDPTDVLAQELFHMEI